MSIKWKVGGCAVREFDMNRLPEVGDGEEEWAEEEEESYINDCKPRKKLRLSKDQSRLLEESFRLNHTLNPVSKIISKLMIFEFLNHVFYK